MAFEFNDLNGILILVLFAIPMVTSTNINCGGRAFHCVNSTHFMICVDLGGGLSTTIDDFIIPCPATTECHKNNVFECDFPEVPTPPLEVIGVYKQSDTSEPNSVTNSVTAQTLLSEIFSVFNENITATTLPILEDVTPVVKVLENIKDPVEVNSENTTDTNFKVTSNFIATTNEVVIDKQTSNMTITTIKPVNTSSTDKSKSIDAVTSVTGLINLISTDHPSVVNTKQSSNVLISLDTLYDNIATTTEQYITKLVTMHGEKVENVTEKIIIPTEIILNERSVTADKVSMSPVVKTYIESNINKTTEFVNKMDSGNQTITERNTLDKSNNTSEHVPETDLAPIIIVNISEPVTVDLSPQKTTDNTFISLGVLDLISADPKQDAQSKNDYINTFYGNTATTMTDQYTTELETFSDKSITAEVRSTPIINTIFQNVFKNYEKNVSLPEFNLTIGPGMNMNNFIPVSITTESTTIEKTFVPITSEANIMYNTETTPKSRDLIEPTDNLYHINRETNQTMITPKKNTARTMDTTESVEIVFNVSNTDIVNNYVTEPTLLSPTTMKNPAIVLTTPDTLQNGFTAHAIDVKNELHATNAPIFVNVPYAENVKNDTLLYNTTNTTETFKTVFSASSEDINNSKSTEPSTLKYPPIEISITETLLNEFTTHGIEAKKLSATNIPISVNEPNKENVGDKALLNVYITPAPYNMIPDPVTSTTVKDLTSQSDIATNPQIGVTQEIIAHTSSDSSTAINDAKTQNGTTDPGTKISVPLNEPDSIETVTLQENSKADQWIKTVVVESTVGMTTTSWNNIENRTTTPIQSHNTEKTSLSDSVKSNNEDNISATSVVNTQDGLLKEILPQAPSTMYYMSELASTTSITVQTTPISIDTKNISEQLSSYTPEIVDVYRAPTTGYEIDISATIPVDVHSTNIENVRDIPVTLLPQESTSQEISTGKQLNTNSTTTETVSDVVHVNIKNIDINTSTQIDSVNIISKDHSTIDINKTETINPINCKKSVNATSFASTEKPNKDESIKIISILDIVNSSVNAMPPKSSNPSLLNDYIKTIESQDTSAYVTATDRVIDYNVMQVGESITQKNPEVIMTLAQNDVMNSVLSSTYIMPLTEINTEKVHTGDIEAPLPSTVELKYIINPTKTAVDYVTEKTNYYVSSTDAILTVLNKLPEVGTESSVSPVSDFTPVIPALPKPLKTVPLYHGVTTIIDSTFITGSTQISHKVVTDNNMKIGTESPLLNSNVMETQTVKYNTESSLPISQANALKMTTEATPIKKINQDVRPEIKNADLPQYVISTVNNNVLQSMPSLPILGVTATQITKPKPIHTTNVFAQTTPLDKMNLDVLPGITTRDLSQYAKSTLNNIPQSMASLPILELAATQITTEPTHKTNVFSQTTPLLSAVNQDDPSGIKTTVLPQHETTTVIYNDTQWVGDITEIISDSLTVPDSMVETINVVEDKVSGTYLGDTTLSDVMSNNSTVNNTNYSVKSVKNIIDHESIVVAAISKNHEQNRPLTSAKSVDINKAEFVNHTESNWMSSDLTRGSVKINESSIEAEGSISTVLKSGTDVQNKTLVSDKNCKEAESGSPKNVTPSKKIITKENKNVEIDSTVNANIERIDVKRFQVQVEYNKIISDGNNINITKANINKSQHNLSLQKSTINDALEQHLISTNHTITTEVQSHLNESDKQSNKTSDELTLNETSMHTPNLTSIKLNAGSNDTSVITVSTLVFNCSNHTRGKYADKKDCRKFYTCIGNLEPILGICPNNTVFSEINKQCTRNLSHCVRNNQFRCLLEGRFSDFFKDNIYYICVKNRMNGFIRYKLQCQDNYHLNKDSVKCEINEEISTQSASSVSEMYNDESKPKPKSEKMVSKDDFECENDGTFPYAKDCSKYYVCTKIKNVYRRKIKKCASEEVFDKKKKKCVESDSGEC